MTHERQFHYVASRAEIPAQSGKTFGIGERKLALFNLAGKFYALGDLCPHRGASLGEGFLADEKVLCPWHCFDFNLQTGECGTVPALRAETYEVKLDGDDIYVLCSVT
jgi:nitrite reductase/ring-hydroxylating ferredoxin subunit